MKENVNYLSLPVPKRYGCYFFVGDGRKEIKNAYTSEYSLDDYLKMLRDSGWNGKDELTFAMNKSLFGKKHYAICTNEKELNKENLTIERLYCVVPVFLGNALAHYIDIKQEIIKGTHSRSKKTEK